MRTPQDRLDVLLMCRDIQKLRDLMGHAQEDAITAVLVTHLDAYTLGSESGRKLPDKFELAVEILDDLDNLIEAAITTAHGEEATSA